MFTIIDRRNLATLDIQVCPGTVTRILKDLDYRLRVNHKRVSAGSGPDRATSSFSISPSRTPNSPNAPADRQHRYQKARTDRQLQELSRRK